MTLAFVPAALRTRPHLLTLRRDVLTVAGLALEGLALAVVAGIVPSLAHDNAEAPSIVAVLITLCVAYGLARWQGGRVTGTAARIGVVVGSVLALGVIARIDLAETLRLWEVGWVADLFEIDGDVWRGSGDLDHVLGVVVLTGVWFRGAALGAVDLEARPLRDPVTWGVVALVAGFLFAEGTGTTGRMEATAIAFTIVALAAIAFRNATNVQLDQHWSVRGTGVAFLSTLAVAVVLVGALLLVVTGLIALVTGSGVAEPILDVLALVAEGGIQLLVWIITPFFWVAQALFNVDPLSPTVLVEAPLDGSEFRDGDEAGRRKVTDIAGLVIRVVGITAAALLFAGLTIWFLRRRLRAVRHTEIDEQRESLWDEAGLGDDLRSAWDALRGRFRRRAAESPDDAAIARLYFAMLADAADLGVVRRPAVTPSQFAPALTRQFNSELPQEISQRFVELRYAGQDCGDVEARRLAVAWGALRGRPEFARTLLG